ncbi:Tetraacyldisaccharide 4'-kinase [Aquirufa nivalisilvae]|uniref:Tetraacyldisaccharide 4'-kinase n=1 Tax=Aquirufa nivalisilvae TaxID=2516557 RepID=A0A2S2DUK4_9BACT|nr:tetraacyldisaccharide 4'-kinase [Aquirufa nivalisilvae]AWL09036.1 Tetraacyldisaccharide 4'-kinase [Aquirufa nivalisilvae]MCZ2480835.1 tetraacyldisaccharide 4'-kinase [Aquirufa nivalisilvae]
MKNIITWFPALLYGLIISLRNTFYDWGWFKSHHFDKPKTIVVGNLAVGGTGKSPLVAYLIKNSPWNNSLGILSRGYGRVSKGFKWVEVNSKASEVGDEPLTYKATFVDVHVAVCESRVFGIQQMNEQVPNLETVILDDAFQHRALKADFNIICTTFDQPYFKDHLMPMGRLREWREGIERADAVVVTRCPSKLDQQQMDYFESEIPKPTFFASIRYGNPIGNDVATINAWHALAGIADPVLFFEQVGTLGELKSTQSFPDHHRFSQAELLELNTKAANMADNEAFIATHKDFVRLQAAYQEFPALTKKMAYLPMEMYFLNKEDLFWSMLNQSLTR